MYTCTVVIVVIVIVVMMLQGQSWAADKLYRSHYMKKVHNIRQMVELLNSGLSTYNFVWTEEWTQKEEE